MSTPCVCFTAKLPSTSNRLYETTYSRARHQMLFKIPVPEYVSVSRKYFCLSFSLLNCLKVYSILFLLTQMQIIIMNRRIYYYFTSNTRWNHNKHENICRRQHRKNPNSDSLRLCGLIFVIMVAGSTRASRPRDLFLVQAENIGARQRQMQTLYDVRAMQRCRIINVCVRKWVLRGFARIFFLAIRLTLPIRQIALTWTASLTRHGMTRWRATYASNFCSADFSFGSLCFRFNFHYQLRMYLLFFDKYLSARFLSRCRTPVRRATFVFY